MTREEAQKMLTEASSVFTSRRAEARDNEALGQAIRHAFMDLDFLIEDLDDKENGEPMSFNDTRVIVGKINQFKRHLEQFALEYALVDLGIKDDDWMPGHQAYGSPF